MGAHQKGLSPQIGYLWPHHRSMARSMVGGGLRPGELAAAYEMTPGQISRIIQSPLFLAELDRIEAGAEDKSRDLREDILKMSERAMEVIDNDLQIKEQGNVVRQKAAFDILDRAGFGSKKTFAKVVVEGDLVGLKQVKEMASEELHDEVMGFIDADYNEEE